MELIIHSLYSPIQGTVNASYLNRKSKAGKAASIFPSFFGTESFAVITTPGYSLFWILCNSTVETKH